MEDCHESPLVKGQLDIDITKYSLLSIEYEYIYHFNYFGHSYVQLSIDKWLYILFISVSSLWWFPQQTQRGHWWQCWTTCYQEEKQLNTSSVLLIGCHWDSMSISDVVFLFEWLF